MNCRNCGMPIVGSRCEYCGTDYSGVYVGGIITPKPYTFDRDKFLKAIGNNRVEVLYANDTPISVKCGGWRWNEKGMVWDGEA